MSDMRLLWPGFGGPTDHLLPCLVGVVWQVGPGPQVLVGYKDGRIAIGIDAGPIASLSDSECGDLIVLLEQARRRAADRIDRLVARATYSVPTLPKEPAPKMTE